MCEAGAKPSERRQRLPLRGVQESKAGEREGDASWSLLTPFYVLYYQEERKRKFEIELDFAPEDIALATVPGLDFDPKTRNFDMEELRPQPIIKKRKKNAVPDEMKDERYWEKRQKNKEATRRSREAKRLKENQIVLRAAYLEKENKVLKQVHNISTDGKIFCNKFCPGTRNNQL